MAISNSQQQIILCLFFIIQAQGCSLQTGNGFGLPSYRIEDSSLSKVVDGVLGRRQQAIISSYKFECAAGQDLMCGNITEWGAQFHPGGGRHDMVYTIDFQVWRPSPTVNDSTGTGCYSLVGNNRFSNISLSDIDGAAQLLSVSPQDYIQFRPGDVLGFFVEEDNPGGVLLVTSPRRFTNELVWYASIAPAMATSQNGDCPYSVGSNGVLNTLTQAAPVISISTVTFTCPLLPTIQPTPQPPNPITSYSEQPLAPLTMPTSTNHSIDENILATDPEGAVTELIVPTTSETATDPRPVLRPREPTDIGLIIGIVVIVIVVIAAVVTVVVIIAVLFKKCHGKLSITAVPTTSNQAYGLNTHHNNEVEEIIYDDLSPEVDVDNTIEAKQNEAYVTNTDIIAEENEAYGTSIDGITMVGNKAYATNIIIKGNQAYYATSIITEKNAAYKPAAVTTTETVDLYEVVDKSNDY